MNFKKSLISIILATELSILGCASNKAGIQRWDDAQKNPPNKLIQIQKYISEIKYAEEIIENWRSAKKTIERGYEDCDGITIVGAYFAEKLGYPPKALFILDNHKVSKGKFHSVTFLEKKTEQGVKYGVIEKIDLIYPVYNSIDDLINSINVFQGKNYQYYGVLNLNSLDYDWRTTDKNLIYNKENKVLDLIQVKLPEKHKSKRWGLKKKRYKIGSIILKR